MRKRKILAAAAATVMLCMTATPVFAGQWIAEGSSWKYYSDNGTLMTGWIEEDGTWYYLLASGTMATGWIKDEGSWYYLHEDGAMAHDTWIDNYYVNSSGKWVKSR